MWWLRSLHGWNPLSGETLFLTPSCFIHTYLHHLSGPVLRTTQPRLLCMAPGVYLSCAVWSYMFYIVETPSRWRPAELLLASSIIALLFSLSSGQEAMVNTWGLWLVDKHMTYGQECYLLVPQLRLTGSTTGMTLAAILYLSCPTADRFSPEALTTCPS